MGGELICSIIGRAPWTKNKKIRLILQPMTHAEKLRAYLLSQGFSIVGEKLAREDKIYQIICAEYTGECGDYTPLELIFGRHNIEKRPEELKPYAEYVRSVYETKLCGKRVSGIDCGEEEKMLDAIDTLLNTL
jgi:tRNA A22 N-methylase